MCLHCPLVASLCLVSRCGSGELGTAGRLVAVAGLEETAGVEQPLLWSFQPLDLPAGPSSRL